MVLHVERPKFRHSGSSVTGTFLRFGQRALSQQLLELSFTMTLPIGPRACGHPETMFLLLDHSVGT